MNFIQYIKQAWKAGTSGGTPISPDRLNHMEDGIKNNNDMISELNNNLYNVYKIMIPAGRKLRVYIKTNIAGPYAFAGIIFVQGSLGAAASNASVQGYGAGSSARYHITQILQSNSIKYTYGQDGDRDFFVENLLPTATVEFCFYEFLKTSIIELTLV
jgi:hypothetical protein|uniref:Uncharacterized protein n=1 Tax=Siphoviridae sp. ctnMb19 TaxID=2825659 RepID=A0A8S5NUX3_9CAUD|nr:MAG TPA: hypothetical protein [Siphoviridae sp. ctnMb19]